MSKEELKQWKDQEDLLWIERINKKIELMYKLAEEKKNTEKLKGE